MQVHITHNKDKNGIELLFTNTIEIELISSLEKLGFKESFGNKLKWYADYHPAYVSYANDLKKVLETNDDWKLIPIVPSFIDSELNIDYLKFSIVEIQLKNNDHFLQTDFIVFESYKKVATIIAERFAIKSFSNNFDSLTIFSRNYKRRARALFKANFVIRASDVNYIIPVEDDRL
ncbi:hypothetical protein IMCC3317_40380 [Kordia antarctica]|uniref:Uncharacterized protein n=1 Tax=Kordia antarctica TaxID=1218801 RepID=A0A7L4ZS60_9FLAO|nr:hypothetical protein [Kordia antarctica]QHI38644.1 hypothetical protein IMCC3317_40380 [Kordia antarctica]